MFASHAKHMLLGGGAILALLLVARVPFGIAVQYAVLLACPLMMAAMMVMMGRGGHGHDAHTDARKPAQNAPAPPDDRDASPPQQRS
jgi:hypothetical protein